MTDCLQSKYRLYDRHKIGEISLYWLLLIFIFRKQLNCYFKQAKIGKTHKNKRFNDPTTKEGTPLELRGSCHFVYFVLLLRRKSRSYNPPLIGRTITKIYFFSACLPLEPNGHNLKAPEGGPGPDVLFQDVCVQRSLIQTRLEVRRDY